MLYNLNWLASGQPFPPLNEEPRIHRYCENEALFDNEHFSDPIFRSFGGGQKRTLELYERCAERIERVIGNFDDVISFPVILGYQRLMSLKMADLICGEPPSITGVSKEENDSLRETRDRTDFDEKLFATVIDLSRFGDAIWRIYKDEETLDYTFTPWDPKEWFPIVAQDGTNKITHHCIAWRENISLDPMAPEWLLHVQVHGTRKSDQGYYLQKAFHMDRFGGTIGDLIEEKKVTTGLDVCAIKHLKSFSTSTTVYGYDDYMAIDSLLAEIMERVAQISVILDKHADPNISGPASMLTYNDATGEYYLKKGSFFAVNAGDPDPKYMVWDGHLSSAFKQLELLLNQLYIVSEMGAALLGGQDGSSQAISGTAMRFKMVGPLAKARRLSNSLKIPVKRLFATLCNNAVEYQSLGIEWFDGLPDDPKENAELAKIVTGVQKIMPLKTAIREYFGRTDEEAEQWLEDILDETDMMNPFEGLNEDPNKPGPQDGTGINPQKNGSRTGLKSFKSDTNKVDGD